jgi:hypothetical protein
VMIWLGLLLAMIGFALVVPRDSMPGTGSAGRIIHVGPGVVARPDSSERELSKRAKVIRYCVGGGSLIVGALIIWFAS